MDLDSTATRKFKPLTDAKKKHRRENNLCMYCGKAGHMAAQCNLKNSKSTGQTRSVKTPQTSR